MIDLAGPWLPMVGIAGALVFLVATGLRLPSLTGILVFLQVFYWTVSYLVRPAVLLVVKPRPVFGDGLSDFRLAADDYTSRITEVLWIIVAGLVVYAVLLALYAAHVRRRPAPSLIDASDPGYRVLIPVLVGALALGLVGRALWILGLGAESSVVQLILYFASLGAIGLVIFFDGSRRAVATVVIAALALELVWSVVIASKTPALAAGVALVLRLGRHRLSGKHVAAMIGVGIAVIAVFSPLQSVKYSEEAENTLGVVDSRYPVTLQPLLDMIRRFDMLSAVTDAHALGAGRWMSPQGFVARAVETVIPQQLQDGDKVSLGRAWAAEVRQHSIPGSNLDVSLASGTIAEGWATGGFFGILAQSAFLVGCLHLVSRLLTARTPGRIAFGVLLIVYPVLFERGILGSLALMSKSFQVVVVVFVAGLLLREMTRSTAPRAPHTPRRRELLAAPPDRTMR